MSSDRPRTKLLIAKLESEIAQKAKYDNQKCLMMDGVVIATWHVVNIMLCE